MLPEWNHIPMYAVLALLGAGAAWFYVHHRLRRRGENPGRTEQAFLWGVLGAMLGAKLLYLLPLLPQLAADLPLICTAPHSFMAKYLSGGFVFYGGLLGWRVPGSSANNAGSPSIPWGGTWFQPCRCFIPLDGWAAFWRGAVMASRPLRAGWG